MVRSARKAAFVLCLGLALLAGGAQANPGASAEVLPRSVAVQPGDMASALAFRLKPRGASIEQMMVALLRANPEAFVQGNVNLLREGAVLRLPAAEQVLATPAEAASALVQRHHQAFLSGTPAPAPVALTAAPAPTASAPTPSASAAEAEPEQDVRERLRAARERLAALEQNIRELERLTALSEASAPTAPAASAAPAAETGLPTSWLWLLAGAIVAVMIGIGHGRPGPRRSPPAPTPAAPEASAQFQARLHALDLNLGPAETQASGPASDPPPGRPS